MRDLRDSLETDSENSRRDVRNITLTPEVKAALIDSIEAASMVHSLKYLAVTGDARLLGLLELRKRRWMD